VEDAVGVDAVTDVHHRCQRAVGEIIDGEDELAVVCRLAPANGSFAPSHHTVRPSGPGRFRSPTSPP
jgi:hypothetical protein